MYEIKKKPYGFKLIFAEVIDAEEMKQWFEDSKYELLGISKSFVVFVDMRNLVPLSPEAEYYMREGQKLYKSRGMQRSVVILSSEAITRQFKEIAQNTGIYAWERYIDASKTKNWEEVGLNWLLDSKNPDSL